MYSGARILFAAPRSGSGKTTVTCAVLAALKKQGVKLAALKCGPDYIDPMFHRRVLGVPTGNLDSFFTDGETTRELLAAHGEGKELTVIEGVMGYFDGLGGTTVTGSTYEIAQVTKTSVILVVDAKGASISLAAEIRGFLQFDKTGGIGGMDDANGIRGILLNRVSATFYPRLKQCLEEECGLPVLGYFPERNDLKVPSRHLGLVSPKELSDAGLWLEALADQAVRSIDLAHLCAIAEAAPPLELSREPFYERLPKLERPVRIAVARDEAFSFFYEENDTLLRRMGAELLPFSPVRDRRLPEAIDGLILGGGYPELFVKELEANPIRSEIGRRIRRGLPCIAECGGFLYLQKSLQNKEGAAGEMAGVFEGQGSYSGGLKRFGYFEAETTRGGLFGDEGTRLKGHEFHHYDTPDAGNGMLLKKPMSGKKELGVVYTQALCAGFPHYYFASCPEAAFAFLQKCQSFQAERLAKERWDQIAHPLGGLGELEDLTARIVMLRGNEKPCELSKKALLVFCGDHGVTKEGVTQSDASVTRNVAKALAEGRSAANALARCAAADVIVFDVGMSEDVSAGIIGDVDAGKSADVSAGKCGDPDSGICQEPHGERTLRPGTVIRRKTVRGTKNLLTSPAMTKEECLQAIRAGEEACEELAEAGYDLLAAGEMGIGNTTSAAALVAFLLGREAEETVGRGAGLDDRSLAKKKAVVAGALKRVRAAHPCVQMGEKELAEIALTELGGFEIAAMTGVFLGGAKKGIPVVADGVISLAAALLAEYMDPRVRDILIVSHLPKEPAGSILLQAVGKKPVLDGGFHLGEGSGAVMLFPLLDMAMAVYRETPFFRDREIPPYKRYEDDECSAL